MRNPLLRLLCITSAFVLGAFIDMSDASAQGPSKYALLVAVSEYENAALNVPKPLLFPEVDAKAVAKVLQDYGYTVDLLLGPQATHVAIREKLEAMSGKGNRHGVVVVGFWGRGHCPKSSGPSKSMYCAFDSTLRTVKDAEGNIVRIYQTQDPLKEIDPEKSVDIDEILVALDSCDAGNRVLLADCIMFGRAWWTGVTTHEEAFGHSVYEQNLPANTAALFAYHWHEQLFEYEPWGHGAFAKNLLEVLPQSVANHEDFAAIAKRLERSVSEAVSKQLVADLPPNEVERVREKLLHHDLGRSVNSQINGRPDLLLEKSSLPTKDNDLASKSAEAAAAKPFASRAIGMEFALVPRGNFAMGSTGLREQNSGETSHSVTITRDFYLGKYEVTQDEFQRVMGFNPSNFTGSTKLPVEQISWFDAVWFCNRLSELDGRTAYYQFSGVTKDGNSIQSATVSIHPTGNGYRLPTEAEWEYACRAGTSLPFHFGYDITTDQANYNGDHPYRFNVAKGAFRRKTVAVDELGRANKFGLVNMHGNVWEWCWDWKADYSTGNVTDPVGPQDGMYRILRGGSWVSSGDLCRSAYRNYNEPNYRTYSVGFRVALSL
ncbi:MAG: SUMF1/EgtB/PvdO family nonheme iron enzyme [Pirellulales bacterium]